MTQNELHELIKPVVHSFGCVLWGIDYRPMKQGALLRIFIDKDTGVTLDNCSDISRQVGALLDVEDLIQVHYTLEVSSTGVDKPLMSLEHYRQYIGEVVKVRLKWPVDGQRNFTGIISAVDEEAVEIDVDGEKARLPYDSIGRGRLQIEI